MTLPWASFWRSIQGPGPLSQPDGADGLQKFEGIGWSCCHLIHLTSSENPENMLVCFYFSEMRQRKFNVAMICLWLGRFCIDYYYNHATFPCLLPSFLQNRFRLSFQEIIYSRIKIQYYRIALACKKDRRRWGKSVAEKIFCSVMSCSADLIL